MGRKPAFYRISNSASVFIYCSISSASPRRFKRYAVLKIQEKEKTQVVTLPDSLKLERYNGKLEFSKSPVRDSFCLAASLKISATPLVHFSFEESRESEGFEEFCNLED